MSEVELNRVIAQLHEAFQGSEKPNPLATYEGSYCDEDVDYLNTTDWETATYWDYVEGQEGAIVCGAKTKAYLIPRLFKIVLLRRHGAASEGAEDDLSMVLEAWPVEPDVEALLDLNQKKAIIAGWKYLDTFRYFPSGSHVARLLGEHWSLSG